MVQWVLRSISYSPAHVSHESIEGEPDQPRALRTGLGWLRSISYSPAHVSHESIEGEPDQPRALRTGLGWTLFGPDPRTHGSEKYG